MSQAVIGGWCEPGFGAVRAEFVRNFTERGELGAAVCVTLDGTVVAHLWGGWSDAEQRRPWSADTLVNVFSVGKGLLAVCAARLAGLGLLDPDAAMTRYWPEFGAAGKGDVTVRQVLSHQAGLPALRAAAAGRRCARLAADDRRCSRPRSRGGSQGPAMAITSTPSAIWAAS